MARSYRYSVTVTESDFASLLDMLRYEGSHVLDWRWRGRSGLTRDRTFEVQLGNSRPPVLGRWASFGIDVIEDRALG